MTFLRCATTWSSRRRKTLLFFGEDEEPLFQTSQCGASLHKQLDFGHYRSQIALELRILRFPPHQRQDQDQQRDTATLKWIAILVGCGALTHRPPRKSSVHICAAFSMDGGPLK